MNKRNGYTGNTHLQNINTCIVYDVICDTLVNTLVNTLPIFRKKFHFLPVVRIWGMQNLTLGHWTRPNAHAHTDSFMYPFLSLLFVSVRPSSKWLCLHIGRLLFSKKKKKKQARKNAGRGKKLKENYWMECVFCTCLFVWCALNIILHAPVFGIPFIQKTTHNARTYTIAQHNCSVSLNLEDFVRRPSLYWFHRNSMNLLFFPTGIYDPCWHSTLTCSLLVHAEEILSYSKIPWKSFSTHTHTHVKRRHCSVRVCCRTRSAEAALYLRSSACVCVCARVCIYMYKYTMWSLMAAPR